MPQRENRNIILSQSQAEVKSLLDLPHTNLLSGVQLPGDLELDEKTLAALQELAQSRPKAEIEALIQGERRRRERLPQVDRERYFRNHPPETSDGDVLPPTDQPAKQESGQQDQGETQVKLSADLAAAAFKQGLTIELITWHRLRVVNHWGSSVLPLETALDGLISLFGCSEKTARRHILRSQGKVLDVEVRNGKERVQIWGVSRVFEALGVTRVTDKHWREIPPSWFCGLENARAQLYASLHRPAGIRGNPTTRATIEARTGLDKTQQRRYEKAAGIKRTPNYGFYRNEDPLGGHGYEPIKIQIYTEKKGLRDINKRLGQTFRTSQRPGAKGILPKVNRQLKSRSSEAGEARNLLKVYFPGFRQLKKVLEARPETIGRQESTRKGFYLIKPKYRRMRGRLEWCFTAL